jgi:hypothetical protein
MLALVGIIGVAIALWTALYPPIRFATHEEMSLQQQVAVLRERADWLESRVVYLGARKY